jgi:hypothetical protein
LQLWNSKRVFFNIVYVKVVANGRIIGEGADSNVINLKKVSKDKAELTIFITASGDVWLETFRFKQ